MPSDMTTIAGRAPRLAVLIDADNVRAVNAEAILNEIASFGDPSLRRVYGDWSSSALGQWKEQARNLGLVMHQQSANTKGKNASDIGLVIDAMDLAGERSSKLGLIVETVPGGSEWRRIVPGWQITRVPKPTRAGVDSTAPETAQSCSFVFGSETSRRFRAIPSSVRMTHRRSPGSH